MVPQTTHLLDQVVSSASALMYFYSPSSLSLQPPSLNVLFLVSLGTPETTMIALHKSTLTIANK